MPRRIGLGKGIDALLDNNDLDNDIESAAVSNITITPAAAPPSLSSNSGSKSKANDIVQMSVEKLVGNPGQPRKNFDETELQELADSIKTYGIIQPIIAANAGDGTYIIIAGERRTRAARLAGLETVPVIVRDYTDQKRLEVSLIENIQRSDLNPIEEAAAYKNLMDFSSLSQEELAVRMGKNRSTVANALRLLKLPVEVQKSIEDGKISPGHARALLSINDSGAMEKLFGEILTNGVSVREAEKRAAALNETRSKEKSSGTKSKDKEKPPELEAMIEKFISRLGTKVTVEGDINKGRIHIEYYSMEDLDRLYEIISG